MEVAVTYQSSGKDVPGHFGFAKNAETGKMAQTLYTRKNGIVTLYWTGKIYKTMRDAAADSAALNAHL